ncbi:hypothetical protein BMH32_00600 [Leucobacter sp. OLJS4]|uniref:DUF2273 domain-containing protein n=1 Tax=unclassified Leucobacter TaxID=2621730 RepID=UPI000C1A1602|nr:MULTISPECIES: DUF2273 domain-containing protein [unclassified Leucobacter]PIJ16274.1 hypothetical protein BMH30_12875 [Leucobacter sp. OLES1]PII83792.1 hypothetical protein BMH25_06725 [Leucobacter sp. OLCALW19]PII89325.1 hypothetical protein BMH26_03765 [Leucobacter sp. OLTLW20]PII90678.1 hypothetical protein BMH27_09995 [Leucobacter sp. OLAS13]PII99607.1 hypothetical protein BMH29_03480 [Leucobacter sp. OLDS2]
MNATLTGAAIGAVLAFAALIFGFWGFLLVALLMLLGALIGRVMSGQLDLRALAGAFSGRRTSS